MTERVMELVQALAGAGQDEDALLRRFLVRPNEVGVFDTYLYDWAVKTPEEYRREKEEKEAKGET